MKHLFISGLFIGLFAMSPGLAQQSKTKTKGAPTTKSEQVRKTKPEIQNVDSNSWETGEVKGCVTFSGHPGIVVCDNDKLEWSGSFINIMSDYVAHGMSKDHGYERAIGDATVKSKRFMVEFSDSYGRDPTPWPKPQTGLKMTLWDCGKEKIISCSLGARED